jgi:phage terminase large subunit
MKVSNVALRTKQAFDNGKLLIVNEGGTGSSKTYSLCQFFITLAHSERSVISIVRKTMPALRGSAMYDFFQLLEAYGLYDESRHDKSNEIYTFPTGAEIEFFGLDQPQKVRGRKRKYLWCNEANEFTPEDFFQLDVRTDGPVFMDYNPSDFDSWIYDMVASHPSAELISSTYLDNPFLGEIKRAKIERLKDEDPNHWLVYGLGKRGLRRTAVYSRYDIAGWLDSVDETIWGLDFGYAPDPSCLVCVGFRGGEIHVDEWIYERNLTNTKLIEKFNVLGVSKSDEIYADSAEPQRIQEIHDAGYNIKPCTKGPDSVRLGVDVCLRYFAHFTPRSTNVYRDWKGYSMKVDKDGKILAGEYVKFNVHGCDAVRYAVQSTRQTKFRVMFSA